MASIPRSEARQRPVYAVVHREHHHIGLLLGAQLRQRRVGGFSNGKETTASVVLGFLPERDGRRGHTDDGHLHALQPFNDVRFKRPDLRAGLDQRVRRKPREPRDRAGLLEVLQAEVEVMVAQHHGAVAEPVHGQHHRVSPKRRSAESQAQRQSPGGHVMLVDRLERRALDGVAAVHQQGVRILVSNRLHQAGDLGQAPLSGLAGEIVDGVNIPVQISGDQQGHRDLPCRSAARQKQDS